jgi:hypothetical protein
MAEKQKLAAILAADVVSSGRLTGTDEDRTLARLQALGGDLIDPTIAVHNRRVFKRRRLVRISLFIAEVTMPRAPILLVNPLLTFAA